MRKLRNILLLAFLAATIASERPLLAQGAVGGTSTYDSAPGISGSGNGASQRRRLSTSPMAIPEDFATLRIAPGFLLSMDVYDAPELSSDLRVDTAGNVTIPLIGRVPVAGNTVAEAVADITKRLSDGEILNNPQVSLNVVQYAGQNVTVMGEIHSPGRIELLAPHTLSEVIAQAGGETQYAGNQVEILRRQGGQLHTEVVRYARSRDGEERSDTMVLPGDTITVRRAGVVYVFGAVNRPGGYLMQENGELNVSQAIALAYGTEMQAAIGSVRLIRKLPDGRVQEIPVPLRDIQKGKVAPPRLQAEDVLYIPVSKAKTILTAGLLNSTATAVIYAR